MKDEELVRGLDYDDLFPTREAAQAYADDLNLKGD